MKESVILVDKKLNFIQLWLFKKSTQKVEKILLGIPAFILIFSLAISSTFFALRENLTMISISGIIALIIYVLYVSFISRYVFHLGRIKALSYYRFNEIIRSKYIVNYENLREIYEIMIRHSRPRIIAPEAMELLKKSSGHTVFESIKKDIFLYDKKIVSIMSNPSIDMICQGLNQAREEGEKIKIKRLFNDKDSIDDLRMVYIQKEGIRADNDFVIKAIYTLKKDKLIKILNEELCDN